MITLQENSHHDYLLFFKEVKKGGLRCMSPSYEKQVNFLISCLEKYKQISLVNSVVTPEKIIKIKKHYIKSPELITIQKSYLKFLKDNLLKNKVGSLSFEHIFNLLD